MAQFICEKQGRCCPHEFYDSIEQAISDSEDGVPCDHLIEVSPVQHGRWVRIGIKGRKGLPIYPCCSVCGIVSAAFRSEWEGLRGPWKFCPNCGAKMDGDADD